MLRAIFPTKIFLAHYSVILTNLYTGLTGERVKPSEDYTLPDRYNIGIVSRRFIEIISLGTKISPRLT